MKKQGSASAIVILLVFMFVLGVVVLFALTTLFKRNETTSQPKQQTGLATAIPGDFFRDGKVTQADITLVQTHLNCKKADACWNKVVGKTHDGDNPLYTFDLDMNQNGLIEAGDIPTLSQ